MAPKHKLTLLQAPQNIPLCKRYKWKEDVVVSEIKFPSEYEYLSVEFDLSDFKTLRERANTENYLAMFSTPKPNTNQTFGVSCRRDEASLVPATTTLFFGDVEWISDEGTPQLSEPPEAHIEYIFSRCGFPFSPEEVEYVIYPSPSSGVEDYCKPEDYRWHFILSISTPIHQNQLLQILQNTYKGVLDYKVYNLTQPILLRDGFYGKDVNKNEVSFDYFYSPGRSITEDEILQGSPMPSIIDNKRKSRMRGGRTAQVLLFEKFKSLYPDEIATFESISEFLLELAKKQDRGDISAPEITRNTDLYGYILFTIRKLGSANLALDYIKANPVLQGKWDDKQLDYKVKDAYRYFHSCTEYTGSLENTFQPEKVHSLNFKELSESGYNLPTSGLVLLAVPEGHGKSEFIEATAKKLKQNSEELQDFQGTCRAPRGLMVCYRRAPLRDFSRNTGWAYYEDHPVEDWAKLPFLCITIQSVHKLLRNGRKPEAYDTLFIDECEHSLMEISGELEIFDEHRSKGLKRSAQFEILRDLKKSARLVVGADASMSSLVSGWFFSEFTGNKELVRCTYDRLSEKKIVFYQDKGKFLEVLSNKVNTGAPTALQTSFSDSLGKHEAIKNLLTQNGADEASMRFYDANSFNQDEKGDNFRNSPDITIPRQYNEGVRFWCSSPVTGVAWSCKFSEFKEIFVLIENGKYFEPFEIKQFCRRYRLADKIHLFVDNYSLAQDEDIVNEFIERSNNPDEYIYLPEELNRRVIVRKALLQENLRFQTIDHFSRLGADISFDLDIGKVITNESIGEEYDKCTLKRIFENEEYRDILYHFKFIRTDSKTISDILQDTDLLIEARKNLNISRDRARQLLFHIERIDTGVSTQVYPEVLGMRYFIEFELAKAVTDVFGCYSRFIEDDSKSYKIYKCSTRFYDFQNTIEKHKDKIQEYYFPYRERDKSTNPGKLLQTFCKDLFLDCWTVPNNRELLKSKTGHSYPELKKLLCKNNKVTKPKIGAGATAVQTTNLINTLLFKKNKTRLEEMYLRYGEDYFVIMKKDLVADIYSSTVEIDGLTQAEYTKNFLNPNMNLEEKTSEVNISVAV